MQRRTFVAAAAAAAAAPVLGWGYAAPPFKISLAQWSLHKALFAKELDHLDFARVARGDFGIEAIEYVNVFFKEKARDARYLAEMNRRAAGEGSLEGQAFWLPPSVVPRE